MNKPVKLIDLVKKNDIESIKTLLETKADIDIDERDHEEKSLSGDVCGDTPLIYAIKHKQIDLAKLLIKAGIGINTANFLGETPLMYAVQEDDEDDEYNENNIELVELLISKGADVNTRDRYGETALTKGIDSSIEVIEALIDAGADVNFEDNGGDTPLMNAVYTGDIELVELLIRSGADVNMQNSIGRTPLIYMLDYVIPETDLASNLKIIKTLIDEGADINIQDEEGKTTLMWAMELGCYYFYSDEDEYRGFEDKLADELLNLLLNTNVDVNIQDNDGNTALMHLAQNGGSIKATEALVEAGADVSLKTRKAKRLLTLLLRKLKSQSMMKINI